MRTRFSISARRKMAAALLLFSLSGQVALARCAFASGYEAGNSCRDNVGGNHLAFLGCCVGACNACHGGDAAGAQLCKDKCYTCEKQHCGG